MSKRQRHKQFYRDTEDEPDSELEEEEDDDGDEGQELGSRDPAQKELEPSPSHCSYFYHKKEDQYKGSDSGRHR